MKHVLLIEPDRPLAKSLVRQFGEAGYSVHVAAGAAQAIDLADQTRPDVVVLELHIPGHNGVEFLHEFSSYYDWQSIPIVVYSFLAPDVLERFRPALERLGCKAFVSKTRQQFGSLLAACEQATAANVTT